jgi:hypothetical protein
LRAWGPTADFRHFVDVFQQLALRNPRRAQLFLGTFTWTVGLLLGAEARHDPARIWYPHKPLPMMRHTRKWPW